MALGLSTCFVRWTWSFLSDRRSKSFSLALKVAHSASHVESLKVMSLAWPPLFVNNLTSTLPKGAKHLLFADDFAIWWSSPDLSKILNCIPSRKPSTTSKNGPWNVIFQDTLQSMNAASSAWTLPNFALTSALYNWHPTSIEPQPQVPWFDLQISSNGLTFNLNIRLTSIEPHPQVSWFNLQPNSLLKLTCLLRKFFTCFKAFCLIASCLPHGASPRSQSFSWYLFIFLSRYLDQETMKRTFQSSRQAVTC